MRARVTVRLKEAILDVQGKAVERSLALMNIAGVGRVRIGKVVEFDLDCPSDTDPKTLVDELCKRLLVNEVMETYEVAFME